MKKLYKVYQKIPHIVYAENVGEAIKILSSRFNNVMSDGVEMVALNEQIPDIYLDALPFSDPQLTRSCSGNTDPNTCKNLLKAYNKAKPKLNFKYCECGCHGSSVVVAGREFSIGQYDWDETNSNYRKNVLYKGHTSCLSPIIGTFPSFEAAALKAEELLKKELLEIKKMLQDDLDVLSKFDEE